MNLSTGVGKAEENRPESGFGPIPAPCDQDLVYAEASRRFVRAGELDRIYISTWQEMGFLARDAEKAGDWKVLGFSSMGTWMQAAFPKSRSVVYAAWGAVKELADMDREDLKEISHSTAHILKKLSKATRQRQDVVAAAKTLSTKDFITQTKIFEPNAHIEQVEVLRFRCDESQAKKVQAAFELVKLFHPEISREEDCLECIAVEYLLSNQEAFENLRGKLDG